MDILVIGSGGREAAIIWKLAQSPRAGKLYCAPGNAGIAKLAELVPVPPTDLDGIVEAAKRLEVDLVLVAPDDPLAKGLVDKLNDAGIRAFGPTAAAARIESSKSFAKDIMNKMNIPTARYKVFTSLDQALETIDSCEIPCVLKADGLALGKGVFICHAREEARLAIRELMEQHKYGEAGNHVLIEEMLKGPEVSVLAFTDGQTLKLMPPARDHKRAFDGDRGPNTGGMGAVVPGASLADSDWERMDREIFRPTLEGLRQQGTPFKGVLYFGLMLTPGGPKVIEYNARFGDPECQAILPLLETDLIDILMAILDERLDQIQISWKDAASCCVVLASGGYPGPYEKNLPITGLESVREAVVFEAGTALNAEGQTVTAGGRVLDVVSVAPDLEDAIELAYKEASKISFRDMMYRRDIGHTGQSGNMAR